MDREGNVSGRTNRKRRSPAEARGRARAAAGTALRFAGRLLLALAVVVGTFSAVVGVYVWATTTRTFAIREVRIEGNTRARVEALARLTGIRPGTNAFLVDLDAAKRGLESHPWVRRAFVRRELPTTVVVTLEEHRPRALVALGDLFLVDAQGEPFKRAQPGDPLDLPVVTGVAAKDATRGEVEARLQEALAFIDGYAKGALGARADLSEVHLDPVRGVSITVTSKEGDPQPVVAHLGQDDHPRRLARLAEIWSRLEAKGDHPKEVFLDNHTRPQWVVARVE